MFGSAKVSVAEIYRGLRIFVPVSELRYSTAPVRIEVGAEQQTDGKVLSTSAMGMQKMTLTSRAEQRR